MTENKQHKHQPPHVVLALTLTGQVVLRSNVGRDTLRTFGQAMIDVAGELADPPGPDDTTHSDSQR